MKNNYSKRISPRWLVLVWLFSTVYSVLAQSSIPPINWQRTLDKNVLPAEFRSERIQRLSITRSLDGGCVVMAEPDLGDLPFRVPISNGHPFITKFGATGNIEWTTAVHKLLRGSPRVVQTTTTGDFLIASNLAASPATYIYLTKISANGESNSQISLPIQNGPDNSLRQSVRDLLPSPDGGFLVVGTEYELNAPSWNRYRILIIKLNKDLNAQWTKRYAASENTYVIKASRAADGGYFISSSTKSPTITGDSTAGSSQLYNFKIDEDGNVVWQRSGNEQSTFSDIVPTALGYYAIGIHAQGGLAVMKFDQKLNMVQLARLTDSRLADIDNMSVRATPDGGCIVVDNYTGNGGSRDYRITKYNQNLDIDWQEKGGGSGEDDARVVTVNDDGTYFIAGTTNSPDLFGRVDNSNNATIWVRKQASKVNALSLTQPTYNCETGAITFNTSGGDGSPITYVAPGISRASATSNTGFIEQGLRNDPKPILIQAIQNGQTISYRFDFAAYCVNQPDYPSPIASSVPDQTVKVNVSYVYPAIEISSNRYNPATDKRYLAWSITAAGLPPGMSLTTSVLMKTFFLVSINGTPTTPGVYPVTVTAINKDVPGSAPQVTRFTITVLGSETSSFALLAPAYTCTTGAITFNTSGGDGSPITYFAPGISRTSATSNTGVVEQGLRNDPKTILIQATQSGQTVSYSFDLKKYLETSCGTDHQPTDGKVLAVLAPTYDCSSGAIHFNTIGGDGSSIEFMAIGITGWTTNPNQYVDKDSRTANDVQPFTLMARQNGRVVTYTWNLKEACGRARIAVEEVRSRLQVSVLGNPVEGEVATISITNALGQAVQVNLLDLQGKSLFHHTIREANESERLSIPVNAATGLLLLDVSTPTDRQQIKLLKR